MKKLIGVVVFCFGLGAIVGFSIQKPCLFSGGGNIALLLLLAIEQAIVLRLFVDVVAEEFVMRLPNKIAAAFGAIVVMVALFWLGVEAAFLF